MMKIGLGFIDADRAAKHDDEIGSEEAFNVEALDARIMVADIVAAVGEKRTEQADILEGDVADREATLRRVFGHARPTQLATAANSAGSA
jgi:hypothetical protein